MRRTSLGDLAAPFVAVGALLYLFLRFAYGSLPPLQFYLPVPIAVLAVAELVAARRVRAAVRHDPDAKPMAAIVIARCVALGKASALVGAAVTGASLALVLRLAPDAGTVRAAASDLWVALAALAASILLLAAGLALERSGIAPNGSSRVTAPNGTN